MYEKAPFILRIPQDDGGALILNVLTGAWLRLDANQYSAFKKGVPQKDLVRNGLLVASRKAVMRRARAQLAAHLYTKERLHLVILPTEGCDFRCVYCYEHFSMGKMLAGIRQGIKRLVSKRAPDLKRLSISWFGGEPLLAVDVIRELAEEFIRLSERHGFELHQHMTTNGYKLTLDVAEELFGLGINHFQVTLDGPQLDHDVRRVKVDGSGSFNQIWSNLISLRDLDHDFVMILRLNLDEGNVTRIPGFLKELAGEFAGDRRFALHLHPVGRWGGPNDEALEIIENKKVLLDLYKLAKQLGLRLALEIGPMTQVCYAALPYSFVIRADGRINKCTVALEEPANQVGRLLPDGRMLINQEQLRPWIFNNALSDKGCTSCALRPACQGASCPWERIRKGRRPCPDLKSNLRGYLELLAPEGTPES